MIVMRFKKSYASIVFFVFVGVFVSTAFCAGNKIDLHVGSNATAADRELSVNSSRQVLVRLIGERAGEIRIENIAEADGCDVFEYEAQGGRLTLRGSSGVAICRGFYDYIKSSGLVLVPETKCSVVELEITGYYGLSPAIRELAIYSPI